jgi:1-acyl-sn-glycerol-3-phosphate acyltransferase
VERPNLIALGGARLSAPERFHIGLARRTFDSGLVRTVIRWCQRHLGSAWIHAVIRRLLHVYGEERLPDLSCGQSVILVSNHRTFFDLYAITARLVRRGLKQRIVFPVRSTFFYDRWLGALVNGLVSFFAMYPPIFRDRKKLALNLASLDELAWLLRQGDVLAGVHPEGTRNKGEDPYALLPAQRGVGRLIHAARVPVVPVFVNGLLPSFREQVFANSNEHRVVVVFGEPIDFSAEYAQPASAKLEAAIAEKALSAVAALGQEERAHRAELFAKTSRALPRGEPTDARDAATLDGCEPVKSTD